MSVSVAASPSAIWTFVADPATPARFSSELRAAAYEAGSEPGVGARIEGSNGRGDVTWTTHSTVVDFVEPTLLRWVTGDPAAPAATWTFEVHASRGGATLTHHVVLHEGVAPLAPALEAEPARAQEIVDGRMAELLASMEAVATGIAGLAESVPDPPDGPGAR